MEFCNCSMFCSALLCVHSGFAIISIGKKELDALLCLSTWCLVIGVLLFLTIPRVCLQFVIVVFPDHTHLVFCITAWHMFLEAHTDCLIGLLHVHVHVHVTSVMNLWRGARWLSDGELVVK